MEETSHNSEQNTEGYLCDFFVVNGLNLNGKSTQEIIESYNLKPAFTDKAEKKKIHYDSVVYAVINGKEKHLDIVHYDLSQEVGKVFLCDRIPFRDLSFS